MPTDFELACRKVGTVVEVLPHGLEQKAKAQLFKACGTISQKAQAKARDLEHVARGELGKVSKDTWKQVAELVRDAAKKHGSPKVDLPHDRIKREKFKPDLVHDVTKGKGKQQSVRVPIRFANGLDVNLLVNYDPDKLWQGKLDLLGGGIGATQKIGDHTTVDMRVFVDTSDVKTNGGGSVSVKVVW
jgi:hypothetical protein